MAFTLFRFAGRRSLCATRDFYLRACATEVHSWPTIAKDSHAGHTERDTFAYGTSLTGRMQMLCRKYSKSSQRQAAANDSDSDSDGEDEKNAHGQRERGDSEFWRRKMRTLHGRFDVNKDGVISFDDFKVLGDTFAALGHLSSEATAEFQNVLKQTWVQQWGEIGPYNLVTVEQYLTEMHHVLNDKALKKKVHNFLPFIFKAIDKDHSGFISLTEFKLFFRCLGLTAEEAAVSFAIIDKNGDGKLSMKEFVKLGRDYFLTEDDRRVSRMFWGPLAEEH